MPTKVEKDAVTGTETTGHEADGIKELNTPLPRWWVWTFYATIIWAIGYWVLYPAWPSLSDYTKGILGWTQRGHLAEELRAAQAQKAVYLNRFAEASFADIRGDQELLDFAIAGGRTVFADNCVPCHGAGGAGAKGYPNLADDDWLWGGDMEAIYTTLRYGIRSGHDETRLSAMPRFGADGILNPEEISDVAEYVLSLSATSSDVAAAKRGAAVYEENCAACHGLDGEGTQELGAPALRDSIWLYGGDKDTVVETITYARGGVMPAWEERLDKTTVRVLTVYVHSLGGGQ